MFHLPKFEKDPNVQYVHIPNFSISFRMPFEPLKTSAQKREVPREKKIQVRPNDKRFQRPSEHWYLPNRKLVGGFKHFLFSISYMGCHPSH